MRYRIDYNGYHMFANNGAELDQRIKGEIELGAKEEAFHITLSGECEAHRDRLYCDLKRGHKGPHQSGALIFWS
jgi:phosphomannomutase